MPKPLAAVDSPLAEAVLEPLTAKLLQEELQLKRISSAELARKLSVPLPVLEDAIKGQTALKIGTWKAVARLLKVEAENFHFRPSERHGGECWELYHVFMVPSALWRRLFPIR